MEILNKPETLARYERLSGKKPPIVMGISDCNLQETVQLIIAEAYLEGYHKGKKKYKRFKQKFLSEQREKELLQREKELLQEEYQKIKTELGVTNGSIF